MDVRVVLKCVWRFQRNTELGFVQPRFGKAGY